jgi:hypothetical protein
MELHYVVFQKKKEEEEDKTNKIKKTRFLKFKVILAFSDFKDAKSMN